MNMKYELLGGNLALDLTNTVHDHEAQDPGDDLTSGTQWCSWAVQAKLLTASEARALRRGGNEEAWLRRVLKLRELLYEIFSAAAQGRKPEPASWRQFQASYRESMRETELQPAGAKFRLAWPAAMNPLDRAMHEIVRAAGELLTSEDFARVRQCSGASCSWLFVDKSRNGMRRWCDMKACGNRDKVRRFRQRQVAV